MNLAVGHALGRIRVLDMSLRCQQRRIDGRILRDDDARHVVEILQLTIGLIDEHGQHARRIKARLHLAAHGDEVLLRLPLRLFAGTPCRVPGRSRYGDDRKDQACDQHLQITKANGTLQKVRFLL